MTVSATQIEEFLRCEELVFFRRDNGDSWMVLFQAFYVSIERKNDGEDLVFHGSPVADLSDMTAEEQSAALRHYMRLNDRILHGRFCGDLIVNYELTVPIEDGEFTATQLERCFQLTVQVTRREKYRPNANSVSEAETEGTDFECEPFSFGDDGESGEVEMNDSAASQDEPGESGSTDCESSEDKPSRSESNEGEQGAA